MGENLRNAERDDKRQGEVTEWDELKGVPFAGFGSAERQRLAEEGRIKDTGAYVLNEQGDVVGVAPALSQEYEKSNMRYERTIGGELEFLSNFMVDKAEFLEEEERRSSNTFGDFGLAYDRYNEQRQKFNQEVEYINGLMRYFRSADDGQLADPARGDEVFDKVRADIARQGDEVRRCRAEGTEAQEELEEATAKSRTMQRVFKVMRAKFEHGARFGRTEAGFGAIYDDDERGGTVATDDGIDKEMVPTGESPEMKRQRVHEEWKRREEVSQRRRSERDEMRREESERSGRFEENRRRNEAQEEQEEEIEMEM